MDFFLLLVDSTIELKFKYNSIYKHQIRLGNIATTNLNETMKKTM